MRTPVSWGLRRIAERPGFARGPRAAAAALVVVAVLSGAAGCSSGERPGGADPTTLTVMLPPSERPLWQPIARAFEAAHPAVRVELLEGPQSTDLRENLYTASLLARDPTFDLVYMDVTWTSKFAAAGWLRPLDDLFPAGERRLFLSAALEAGRYAGRLYRIPVRTDIGVVYYRSDLLAQAGFEPPRTTEELMRTARALQSPPRVWGYVWQGKQYEGLICNYLELLHGHGGYWIDPASGSVGLDRPEALSALAFLVACIGRNPISPPGVTTYQEEESRRIFQDGRAVFLRSWPYAWRLSQAEDSPLRGRVGVMPMVSASGERASGTLGGWGLGVSAYSRNPRWAREFVRFAVSLESQRMLCLPSGYAPAREDAYADAGLMERNPLLTELHRMHAGAVARPAIARYALASDILQRHLSAALTGSAEPARALAEAARETRALGLATSSRHSGARRP